jgi:tetratricopeptide (TPR) repeat protein
MLVRSILGTVSGLVLALLAAGPTMAADDSPYVQILSATVRDQKIAGATVILQRNGQQSRAATTNAEGRATVDLAVANDPSALVIVRKEGYSDLVAKCPCTGLTYAVSPVLERLDEMRIVLNWGRYPEDLDAHLAFENSHVFFINKEGADAQLDLDQTSGFGPETITITRRHPGTRYVFGVQNYRARTFPTNADLSTSDAKVFIYVGRTLVRSYYVPKGQIGNMWTVFAISEEGEIQDINRITRIVAQTHSELSPDRLFGGRDDPRVASSSAPVLAPTPIAADTKRLNTEGEAAYQRGDYARAIELFQAAIDQNGNYGQAYSNLGLTFQKSGRVAEALWANRKAIALASGASAARTRASTHFNNGRIYEDAGQWNDALREYVSAAREKPNATYDNAIQRMRDKGVR